MEFSWPPWAFQSTAAKLKHMGNRTSIVLFAIAGVCLIGGVTHFVSASAPKPPTSVAAETVTASRARQNISVARTPSFDAKAPEQVDAVAIWKQLLAADPADRTGRQAGFLYDLCRSGKFEAALQLANEASADVRGGFLKIIFNSWAQSKPQDAVKALESITGSGFHRLALRAVADGWNVASPGGLAVYANTLAAGDDRDYALGLALDNWSLQDPAALGAWLNTLPSGHDFDAGVSLMLAKADGANITPRDAMKWVEAIGDSTLKFASFAHVLAQWHRENSVASQQYVASAEWLSETQRQKILKLLGRLP